MRLIDEQYMRTPFYGWPRMTHHLRQSGHGINHKRVQRLMRLMGLEAIHPKANTSKPDKEHRVYPYLLREVEIRHPWQVWCADITYVPMRQGFMYLVAIMDWFSRFVLAWEVSNSLDTHFCLRCLAAALKRGRPEIFNLTFRRTEMRNPPFFTGAELSVFRLLSMVIRKGHEHERVE